jgi:hypothetical protein
VGARDTDPDVPPGDLWEHINGAAEQFLAYGFQDLATTSTRPT